MTNAARDGLVELERVIATLEGSARRTAGAQLVIEIRAGSHCPAAVVLDPVFLETLRDAAAALRVALVVRR